VKTLLEFDYPKQYLSELVLEDQQLIYKFVFDINCADVLGQSTLYIACSEGYIDIVEYLVTFTMPAFKFGKNSKRRPSSQNMSGGSDSSTGDSSETPQKGSPCTCRPVQLIRRNSRFIPLHAAIIHHFYEITDLLLNNKADPNSFYSRDNVRVSALSLACKHKDSLALDKLLQAGADDVNRTTFNKAAEEQQNLIPILLKYR